MPDEQQWTPAFTALRQLLLDFMAGEASEIDLQQGDLRLRARKSARRAPAPAPSGSAPADPVVEPPTGVSVDSPLTGVVYLSPSPQTDPYVRPGDQVEVGQVIALVEAMKVFNEVKSEHAGRVLRILVNGGDVVQAGQAILQLDA